MYMSRRSICSKITFPAMYISRMYTELWKELEKFEKHWNYQSLNTTPNVGKLNLV